MRLIIFFLSVMTIFAADIEKNLSLINQGKTDEAITNLRQALEETPDSARARELLGLAYLKQNKLEDAEREVSEAVKKDPDLASARVSMARVGIAKQNWTMASDALKKATELDSGNQEIALYRGSMSLARKDYKAAVDALSPYVVANPDEPYGHYYLGLAQYGMKRPDKTVEQLQRFLSLAPNAPEAPRVESLLRSIR